MDASIEGSENSVFEISRIELYNIIKEYQEKSKRRKKRYETAGEYVTLYSRHPMSPTVHTILMHSSTVIQNSIIPIGQQSEEAAEARNKHFRRYRQSFSRKCSRELCNRDILNRLLLSSDPFLSCSRKPLKNKKPFSKEVREMLVAEYQGSESSPEDTESVDEDFPD